jgi:hypothetical protein
MQNFSEDYMLEHVLAGELSLPAGDTPEPFVDADDIAEVAVAALTDDKHIGELYELTGPRLLTFAEAAEEIGRAAGREVRYVPVCIADHEAALAEQGVPAEAVELLTYLFATVLDGRNAQLADGRPARARARAARLRRLRAADGGDGGLECLTGCKNVLARVEPAGPEAADRWRRYLVEWTAWNSVRTVAITHGHGDPDLRHLSRASEERLNSR